jgi:peptidoglycan/xylan/chitin deacetylase (PgdA/CDA1 family)
VEAPKVISESSVRALIAQMQAMPVPVRGETLAAQAAALRDDDRQMLTTGELQAMAAGGVAVGTHGKAHEPMTSVADVDTELRASKVLVAERLGLSPDGVSTLSFPFSKQNDGVIQRARAAGYELLFGGGLSLTPLRSGLPDLLARVGITAHEVSDSRGNLVVAQLASALFRRPHRRLEPAT